MAGANPQLLSGGHFEAEWRVKIKNYISNTSVLRGLDHFITSPDTPVCWIFCVNIWYFRFQFSLDRPIPIQIILLIIFPVRCKKYFKKENWLELRRFSAFGTRHATACSAVKAFFFDAVACPGRACWSQAPGLTSTWRVWTSSAAGSTPASSPAWPSQVVLLTIYWRSFTITEGLLLV